MRYIALMIAAVLLACELITQAKCRNQVTQAQSDLRTILNTIDTVSVRLELGRDPKDAAMQLQALVTRFRE